MLTIEKGKYYRTREGRGPYDVRSVAGDISYGYMGKPGEHPAISVYTETGRCLKEGETRYDFVSEWVDTTEPETPPDQPLTKHGLLNLAIEATRDRGLNYGKPEDNFRRIARLWNAHLENRYGTFTSDAGEVVTRPLPVLDEHDVVQLMILMKVARLENSPAHIDSLVDVAGYAACGGEIAGRK